jgi:hypothetical protein
MSVKDYLAFFKPKPGDKLDYGVRGMKWGIRRSSSQLRAAAASRALQRSPKEGSKTGGAQQPTSGAKKPTHNIQDHVETSSARYARLAAEAKAGRADKMTEQDLKFFNARTDALAKINKLNETKSGWLASTTKTVLQSAAQKQMQAVVDGVANKYISGPIIENLKGSPSKDKVEQAVAKVKTPEIKPKIASSPPKSYPGNYL